ncbi:hypothetical protein SSX86_016887 [Deinandra increscens subsp. villosa]|uniref:PPIase cyclophilin-type domain-containing protein n=1 Tax=Deinandra increscens subsp. villosa TaxID=3103831 RepID=A0AAP0CZD0_9ASTR
MRDSTNSNSIDCYNSIVATESQVNFEAYKANSPYYLDVSDALNSSYPNFCGVALSNGAENLDINRSEQYYVLIGIDFWQLGWAPGASALIIRGYGLVSFELIYAYQLFDVIHHSKETDRQNLINWNALFSGSTKCGSCKEATNLKENITIDVVPLVSISTTCGDVRAFELGGWIKEDIAPNHLQRHLTLLMVVVNLIEHSGLTENVLVVFENTPCIVSIHVQTFIPHIGVLWVTTTAPNNGVLDLQREAQPFCFKGRTPPAAQHRHVYIVLQAKEFLIFNLLWSKKVVVAWAYELWLELANASSDACPSHMVLSGLTVEYIDIYEESNTLKQVSVAQSSEDITLNTSMIYMFFNASVVLSSASETKTNTGGKSINGGIFVDENFKVDHSGSGLLSKAICGSYSNKSKFIIIFQRQSHLDGLHVNMIEPFRMVIKKVWHRLHKLEPLGIPDGILSRLEHITYWGALSKEFDSSGWVHPYVVAQCFIASRDYNGILGFSSALARRFPNTPLILLAMAHAIGYQKGSSILHMLIVKCLNWMPYQFNNKNSLSTLKPYKNSGLVIKEDRRS